MASSYKTPGVYVEEISIFPPSVAQVETAIPAFIGYTNMAKDRNGKSLDDTPQKITSMLEFVTYFGGSPKISVNSVKLNNLNQVTELILEDNYYLYEAMRLFYANGGGKCYVVSVGKSDGSNITLTALKKGLDAIAKVDEPTLLVAPDACILGQSDMNSLYQAMLAQCGKLGDRFAIFDLKNEESLTLDEEIQNFRNGIGMNNLKYGAAYTPWLKANLPREVSYASIKGKINRNGSPLSLADLIDDADAKALANQLDQLIDDSVTIDAQLTALADGTSSADARYDGLVTSLKLDTTKTNFQNLINLYIEGIDFVRDTLEIGTSTFALTHTAATPPNEALLTHLKAQLDDSVNSGAINTVVSAIQQMKADFEDEFSATLTLAASATGLDYATGTANGTYFSGAASQGAGITAHLKDIMGLYGDIKSAVDYIRTTVSSYVSTYENSAVESIPTLKNIKNAIASEYLTLPPSAAMAGVYSRIDENRGVWKAPANTSLNSVVGVTELIDHDQQKDINVDVVAGKSINAIRPFTGKGIMVWGARTLAGNDNEWRYISVRRFFNMVEESVKKATEQFVFEANDANTWVKVRAMIENFLNLQWRAGALAGAKPNDAFFVRVGLGETMTAEDILNGVMNIEIGMAVVRPAEFIILKFSHKMQES
ncbi:MULTISPECIES: phage tail sheath C-terminal domain-containing protein [unclassified Leeuwenhoekiella]|uniref:phage tail sheath C-terminal domain-containing protein n=1 Tax=unclassified Leeuwenhoekiella TaxID=2615029 RepID=UPI000C53C117|nr:MULTISPECIES: phage tail sheath C-terminal domain-containing protein [unclassified Leeuwenhoekiella]MAW95188.1 phage tail protein [Leeuwenhoekiella sp.]MBA81889.1 phage tail protein [Leeuwenhoekiella sp.]|tara:strand:- start:41580 stop:43547 length:1968 start_codon:yes stop_codon:yes gene_type:complete